MATSESYYDGALFHQEWNDNNNFLVSMKPYTITNYYWVPAETSEFRQWAPIEASDFRLWVPVAAATEGEADFLKSKTTSSAGLKMVAGSLYLPKDDPEKPEGDDAHFISLDTQTIGVADGVGGWSKKGIDAGKYARELMTHSRIAAESEPMGAVNPKRVMQEAFSKTKAQGSSTACIITLSGSVLYAANVGDSGFMVIRDGRVVYRSPVQQRCHNCPYQLGNCKDDPSLAQEFEVSVEKGDIIVAGTDGVFDNLHGFEIEDTIKSSCCKGKQPDDMARTIANLALYNSFDRFAASLYARESRKAGHSHRGGKIDDITVIVARIQSSD